MREWARVKPSAIANGDPVWHISKGIRDGVYDPLCSIWVRLWPYRSEVVELDNDSLPEGRVCKWCLRRAKYSQAIERGAQGR